MGRAVIGAPLSDLVIFKVEKIWDTPFLSPMGYFYLRFYFIQNVILLKGIPSCMYTLYIYMGGTEGGEGAVPPYFVDPGGQTIVCLPSF